MIYFTLYTMSPLFITYLFSRPSNIQEVVRCRPSKDTPTVSVSTIDLSNPTPID